jgi:exodeoxyribonuclease VII small subunit
MSDRNTQHRTKRLEAKDPQSPQVENSPIENSPTEDSPIEDSRSPDWQYETTVLEIETLIEQIERGQLPLAEVFDQFAIAVQRLRQCESFLTHQQQQVDLLIETLLDESEG